MVFFGGAVCTGAVFGGAGGLPVATAGWVRGVVPHVMGVLGTFTVLLFLPYVLPGVALLLLLCKAVNVVETGRWLPRAAGPAWAQAGGLALCVAALVYRQGYMPLVLFVPALQCDGAPSQVHAVEGFFPPSLRCVMPDGSSQQIVPEWVPCALWPLVTVAGVALAVSLVLALRAWWGRRAAGAVGDAAGG